MTGTLTPKQLKTLADSIDEIRRLAVCYKALMKRPLGVTGEIGEYEACRILDLKLCTARTPGYDAISKSSNAKFEIKTRCICDEKKNHGRMPKIDLNKKWDEVLLVLLDEGLKPHEIYEASRRKVQQALTAPGSKSRNIRGQLSVSKFKSIGRRVWPLDSTSKREKY